MHLAALLCGVFSLPSPASAQGSNQPDLSIAPLLWARATAGAEVQIVNTNDDHPLRYRVRTVNAKGETLRVSLESKDGTVARLVEKNGQRLTAAEDADERERLEDIRKDPAAFLRHVHRDAGSRTYATEMLRSMPSAMLWTYTPGQPQLPTQAGSPARPAVVLDFKPDPAFKPPTLITEALTGITGRAWIDAQTHCLLRVEGHILHPVNFGWGGVLARIKEGGYIELDQRPAANGRWLYSHVLEHLSIREVLVHTSDENSEITALDVEPLPRPLTLNDAVNQLLAMPVPLR